MPHEHHVPYTFPFLCSCFGPMLSAAACGSSAVLSQSAPSAVSGCTVPRCKEQYCPRSPVNWLITSLMRTEQPVTMGHIVRRLSDF